MLIFILGILLLLVFVNYIPLQYREGATVYKDYDESNCQSLAKQNQNNIDVLQQEIEKYKKLEIKVYDIQKKIDANTTQVTSLAEQVYKTPK